MRHKNIYINNKLNPILSRYKYTEIKLVFLIILVQFKGHIYLWNIHSYNYLEGICSQYWRNFLKEENSYARNVFKIGLLSAEEITSDTKCEKANRISFEGPRRFCGKKLY